MAEEVKPYDSDSMIWNVIGFLISPILAFILWAVLKKKHPDMAHGLAVGAWVAVAAYVILIVANVILALVN